jgi:hypothetical protein
VANGFDEAKALRDFESMPAADRERELWLAIRRVAYDVRKLSELVTGNTVNAWLMRLRNALTWAAPIAALAVAVYAVR